VSVVVSVVVSVDGDGDGDALVAAQLGQHRDHSREKLNGLPIPLVLKSAQSENDIEHRRTLHGRAPRNREMSCTIGLGSSTGSLRDVERNGKRCAPKLVA